MAQICKYCGCGVGRQLQLRFNPSLGTSMCHRYSPKKTKNKIILINVRCTLQDFLHKEPGLETYRKKPLGVSVPSQHSFCLPGSDGTRLLRTAARPQRSSKRTHMKGTWHPASGSGDHRDGGRVLTSSSQGKVEHVPGPSVLQKQQPSRCVPRLS